MTFIQQLVVASSKAQFLRIPERNGFDGMIISNIANSHLLVSLYRVKVILIICHISCVKREKRFNPNSRQTVAQYAGAIYRRDSEHVITILGVSLRALRRNFCITLTRRARANYFMTVQGLSRKIERLLAKINIDCGRRTQKYLRNENRYLRSVR